jgi:hypothetical protein
LRSKSRLLQFVAGGAAALGVCSLLFLLAVQIPAVRNQVEYRWVNFRAQVVYALNPPEEVVFTPNPTSASAFQATLTAPTATRTPGSSQTPTRTPDPTLVPTPIPTRVVLEGIRHEYQGWNNCGPATLSMGLSFWGWEGFQGAVATAVKPNPRDKNVMPYELVAFVEEETGLRALTRVGGSLELLRSFIAAGFPVIIEKGFEGIRFEGWMGHYLLISGYDEGEGEFIAQDAYNGPNQRIPEDDLYSYWRHFNFTFLLIYSPERESEAMEILGPMADATVAQQVAAQRASEEIFSLSGRDQYFAWFNRGSSLMLLQDYAGAAAAYDSAFALYPNIPSGERPWRMLWYQTGPYFAYYYSQRYGDVISLATTTLSAMDEPILEESYYWRALAREAVGDSGAVDDYRAALEYHPDFGPAVEALDRLGAAP